MLVICALHILTTCSFSIKRPFQIGGGLFRSADDDHDRTHHDQDGGCEKEKGGMLFVIPISSAAMMVPAAVMLLPISHQSDRC